MEEAKIEQNINKIIVNADDLKSAMLLECKNPFKIEKRTNRSALQFNGDTFYTLYTETKFNKFQKFLWKRLLNIKITDVLED